MSVNVVSIIRQGYKTRMPEGPNDAATVLTQLMFFEVGECFFFLPGRDYLLGNGSGTAGPKYARYNATPCV